MAIPRVPSPAVVPLPLPLAQELGARIPADQALLEELALEGFLYGRKAFSQMMHDLVGVHFLLYCLHDARGEL